MIWHQERAVAVLQALDASPAGLTSAEAARRLAEHGPNQLPTEQRWTWPRLLAAQFANVLILILLAAAAVSALVGDVVDTVAIAAIVILNAAIGFVQEFRAERAMEALTAMAAPTATALRDGGAVVIPAAALVPGDVVLLEAGRIVPADVRLLDAAHLRVDEAALTGESVPVDKTADAVPGAAHALGDRGNMAFTGTVVTYGRGRGVVVATGAGTEFGRIATLLQGAEEPTTPLQRRLARFGRRLAVLVLVVCAIVFAAGVARGEPVLPIFLVAVTLAVAAIPEALPAVVTISLALGARAMAARRALVRRLSAVETLGSVTYICSDKTGTLTMNRMRVEAWYCEGRLTTAPGRGGDWDDLLRALALSNDAEPGPDGALLGDPTEVALQLAAREAGVHRPELERDFPRVGEVPFDSHRRCMTTVHRDPAGGVVAFTKGAVEAVLARSRDGGWQAVRQASARLAADGLRVLAVAVRRHPALPPGEDPGELERDLTFLGLVGLLDPPRAEAGAAVATCRQAGIVPVMITGDHALTAEAIARRLGILEGGADGVLTGPELAELSPAALAERVEHTRVYARVAPEQKLQIVTALQARGQFVAVTGDGVNDAPALRRADIGVAMGITGTDVAKEASAMVLLDDDFATIVRAVREGRRIYDNLRRFIRYVVTTNAAEVWTVFLAPFLGLPIPLLPVQILWINLVTDGLPGLALSLEPEEPDVMRRPPRPPGEGVFAHGLGVHALVIGLLMAGLTLATQAWFFHAGSAHWQTMTFTVLCLCQLAHVLAVRSERQSLLTQGLLSNKLLLGAVVLTLGLQLATIYVPALRRVFGTQPLAAGELALAVAIATVVFLAVEGEKWVRRRAATTGA